jgi:hypothetical protein
LTVSIRSVPPEGGTPTSTILELDVANEDDIRGVVVFAYLLGRKSLLDPTTPRRTLEHDPNAKTQGGPFRTIGYRREGSPDDRSVMS